MVSSLSPHSQQFCCVLSILALILLVVMVLFCAAIRRDSVSLLKFSFLNRVKVFSCEMLFISRLKGLLSCFYSHFCFLFIVILLSIALSVSFLVVVISPTSCYSMWSSSRCIDASKLIRCRQIIFLTLFSVHIVCQRRFGGVMPYAWSLVFLFLVHFLKFISGPFQKGSRISNEGHSPSVYSFDKVSARVLSRVVF